MSFIWLFIIIQLANVILSTIKSILTIKANKLVAAIANSVYFGFYTIVLVFTVTGDLGLLEKVLISVVTNFIGVYFGLDLLERIKRDKLWEIRATIKGDGKKIADEINSRRVSFTCIETNKPGVWVFNFYSESKKESKKIQEILKDYHAKHVIVLEESVKVV